MLSYVVPLDDESCILNGVARRLFQRGDYVCACNTVNACRRIQTNGVTFGNRHDILKGYTGRNLNFL